MDGKKLVSIIGEKIPGFVPLDISAEYADEISLKVVPADFKGVCLVLHKILASPVMMIFAVDERADSGVFVIYSCFADMQQGHWITVKIDITADQPSFESLSKSIYSANLFEREIWEMFGIKPQGHPDLRSLHLHNEICSPGNHPLRKDFISLTAGELSEYKFIRVEGEGIFEVPVGPVHAGIIGPGHFRFSAAGEPIINLEIRLGFTHRGVEKLMEGKAPAEGLRLAERVSGDSSFAHGLAFCRAMEKISGIVIPGQVEYARAIFLELERMYNHVNDLGGIALDVGFGFPAAFASVIKEALLQLNDQLSGSRYLKDINTIGGARIEIDEAKAILIKETLKNIGRDFGELQEMLFTNVSFMDRVDGTGILHRKIAEDLGIVGMAGRASGIAHDLRKSFPGVYREAKFRIITAQSGDVQARLRVRTMEFEESLRLIVFFISRISNNTKAPENIDVKQGTALGYSEGWRGPILYWLKINAAGRIERCKIVDPSFHNWPGLSHAVLGNIIPDFPLCNKSFDLSYAGNDL